jgi:hypothetical protein
MTAPSFWNDPRIGSVFWLITAGICAYKEEWGLVGFAAFFAGVSICLLVVRGGEHVG